MRTTIYSGPETVSVYDGNDDLVREFVFGQVIDEVLMMEQADVLDFDSDSNTTELTRSFYHRNALGSVMEITDMNEAVAVSYRYNPYGAVTITRNSQEQSSDPLGNPWMYTARFHDEETGLEYYRARYYSTETGRFLQRDPLGYGPGPNSYEYAHSSPLVYDDPTGLDAERDKNNEETADDRQARGQEVVDQALALIQKYSDPEVVAMLGDILKRWSIEWITYGREDGEREKRKRAGYAGCTVYAERRVLIFSTLSEHFVPRSIWWIIQIIFKEMYRVRAAEQRAEKKGTDEPSANTKNDKGSNEGITAKDWSKAKLAKLKAAMKNDKDDEGVSAYEKQDKRDRQRKKKERAERKREAEQGKRPPPVVTPREGSKEK